MKHIHALLAVCFFLLAFGEKTALGGSAPKQARSEYSLMISYISPAGKFKDSYQPGTYPQFGEALTQSMQGDIGGMGAKPGYGADFTGYYYLNSQPVQTAGGIQITYLSFTSIPFRWNTDGDYPYNDAKYRNLNFYSFKIGPMIKIEIDDETSFRIYDQICGVFGTRGSWSNAIDRSFVGPDSTLNEVHEDASLKIFSGTGFKNEAGFSFNSGNFILAGGFSFGTVAFDKVEYRSTLVTTVSKLDQPSGTYQYVSTSTQKQNADIGPYMPTSYLFFSVGLKF